MKINRKIIEIDEARCNGCGNCVVACAEGAIKIVDGVAKVIADKYCDGLGACIGDCPEDALKIIEREAEEFDADAVETLLREKDQGEKQDKTMACGCPSSAMKMFPTANEAKAGSCASSNKAGFTASGGTSALRHWPVQIRLVPPGAPFLKNADLLIAADCVPVACPSFHADFLQGKAVMIGCPKFDNPDDYIEKLSRIFKASRIKSITAVVMEVPCCSGLPMIIKKARQSADVDIPLEEIVISARGERLS